MDLTEPDDHDRAVELLKELGMKTYEAECFAALARIPSGTARDISDVANVPRTRVYDATETLAEKGFVEVQHTNPQRFRAIPLSEAIGTLREQYEDRVEELHETLSAMESEERSPDENEVWSLSAEGPLDGRVCEFVGEAQDELILAVGDERCWNDRVAEALADAERRGVDVHLAGGGHCPETLRPYEFEGASVTSELDWLQSRSDDVPLGRLLLVDARRLFVSTVQNPAGGERAIVAEGGANPFVALCRRLLGESIQQLAAEP